MVLAHGGAYATVSADGSCSLRFNFTGPFMWQAPSVEAVTTMHLATVLGKDTVTQGDGDVSADMGQLLEEYVAVECVRRRITRGNCSA